MLREEGSRAFVNKVPIGTGGGVTETTTRLSESVALPERERQVARPRVHSLSGMVTDELFDPDLR
jgi:hypothetical protein